MFFTAVGPPPPPQKKNTNRKQTKAFGGSIADTFYDLCLRSSSDHDTCCHFCALCFFLFAPLDVISHELWRLNLKGDVRCLINVMSKLIKNTKQSNTHSHTHDTANWLFHPTTWLLRPIYQRSKVYASSGLPPPPACTFTLCTLYSFPFPSSRPLSQPCSLQQYAAHYGWVHLSAHSLTSSQFFWLANFPFAATTPKSPFCFVFLIAN